MIDLFSSADSTSFSGKLKKIEWSMFVPLVALAIYGTFLLYSAAGGSFQPWAGDHIIRFFVFVLMMIFVAMVDIRIWYQLAYPTYAIILVLLVGVDLFGSISKGAQRWLQVGPLRIQPSEFMKLALIFAMARYYQDSNVKNLSSIKAHIIPMLMLAIPAGLIMKQPDLGTGMTVALVGGVMIVLAGISWAWVLGAIGSAIGLFTFAYFFVLHQFQRDRILIFLNPEHDKLGKGYQITQAKIAIGSGGFWGSGFMHGTQTQLDFLPERHTDFVFAMLLEEFGMIGGVAALVLYALVMGVGVYIALTSRHTYGKLVAGGVTTLIFIYVSINAAMIMGLVPVVGMPMPFLSYGGSVMLSVMFALGLVQNVKIYRDKALGTGFSNK